MQQLLSQLGQYWASVIEFFTFDTALLSEPDMIVRLCVQLLLLAGSAFFSSSETALFSLSRLDLQQLRRERNPRAETIHELLDQPRRLIISILSGNELVNIAASVNMAGILVVLYGGEDAGWINLIVMVPLLLLVGEVTPKTVAVSNPVRYSARIVAVPMKLWVQLISPAIWVIREIADRITTWMVGEAKAADNILQVDEFLTLVEQVSKEGVLDATERALIYNLLDAGETEIVEVMAPRTQMAFINYDMPFTEVVEKFIAYRHPRVPVFKTHRDNLVGFLHAEDILRLVLDDKDIDNMSIEDVMHPPVVVPLTKKVDEMFDFFQQHKVRAAACLNEFGGVDGFITMRGVLSYIFGDISGGTPATAKFYTEKDINVYDVPGEMRLTDFDDLTNFGILDPRMTTIGGVAFRHLDRLPRVGDRVTFDDIQIEVLEMNEHRIARVRVAQGVDLDDLIDDSDVHVTEQEDLKDKTLDRPDAEEVEEGIDEELEIIGEEEADQFDENGDGFEAPRTGTEP
ncbi:MAG: hemolysin family protein [Gammaproteobacteria bacterium]|nr:hemolysin family protein [Gammaproteobacteria bacterium]MXY65489.1 HlyC/CorC family transporter [Gammaproteobacteria bacterium]MYG66002.1 HlyC/CorC family transporter [Gammaproteobacteria bacterium]